MYRPFSAICSEVFGKKNTLVNYVIIFNHFEQF